MNSENNEITLKIKGSAADLITYVKARGYKMKEKFHLYDTYLVPDSLDLKNMTSREILAKALIIRRVEDENRKEKYITFKKKDFDDKGNILKQNAIHLGILDTKKAEELLNAIGYKTIMEAAEHDVVYAKGDFGILVKDVEGQDDLIEIEASDKEGLRTVEELVKKVKEEKLPVEMDNYFVKKAEIILDKVLGKNHS